MLRTFLCVLLLVGCMLAPGGCALGKRYEDIGIVNGTTYRGDKVVESAAVILDPGHGSSWSIWDLPEETFLFFDPDSDRRVLWDLDALLKP